MSVIPPHIFCLTNIHKIKKQLFHLAASHDPWSLRPTVSFQSQFFHLRSREITHLYHRWKGKTYVPEISIKRRYCNVKSIKVNSTESDQDLKNYSDFKKKLKLLNVDYKDGYTCLKVPCVLCDCRNSGKFAFVNKRTGSCYCPNCDIRVSLLQAKDAFEKKQIVNYSDATAAVSNYERKCVMKVPVHVCEGLQIRGIKPVDFEILDACYDPVQNAIQFPLKNASNRLVGEKLLFLDNGEEETFQNEPMSGIVTHGSSNKQRVIVVSNLLDFLALVAQRIDSHSIVCLPYGLQTLPQECLPCLEQFKELVLWFKCDSPGWDVAIAFANKLDEKRCLIIRPTDSEPSPFNAQHKRLNLKEVLQRATPIKHKSITTFHTLRKDILSELQNIEKVNGVKWKRFPILNKLLKGHRKGELTIITGPTGSGKTTFMSEYSLDLAVQGVSTLWGSFEIRNSRLASTLLRQYVGYSLEKKLDEFDHWATEFEKYPMYFMTFHGQHPLKVVIEAIEHAHYVHDINHVIIDNLQFMMGISNSYRLDKFWEQDTIIAAFRTLATKHNIHVTLVMHPRKEREEDDLTTSSIFGSAKASQEADNVLIIQDKRLTSIKGKKYLQIAKNRYSGDIGIMTLEFNKEALSYAASGQKKKKEKHDKEGTYSIEKEIIPE